MSRSHGLIVPFLPSPLAAMIGFSPAPISRRAFLAPIWLSSAADLPIIMPISSSRGVSLVMTSLMNLPLRSTVRRSVIS